jgi:hypothetical protein
LFTPLLELKKKIILEAASKYKTTICSLEAY